MYCTNCGAKNPEGSAYCNNCGHKLTPQAVPQQTQGAAVPARKTNGLAIAALVLGIASVIPPLAICSIPAIVLGAVALNQIKKEPELEGRGMALTGLICGSVILALWILIGIFIAFVTATSTTITSSDFWISSMALTAAV